MLSWYSFARFKTPVHSLLLLLHDRVLNCSLSTCTRTEYRVSSIGVAVHVLSCKCTYLKVLNLLNEPIFFLKKKYMYAYLKLHVDVGTVHVHVLTKFTEPIFLKKKNMNLAPTKI